MMTTHGPYHARAFSVWFLSNGVNGFLSAATGFLATI